MGRRWRAFALPWPLRRARRGRGRGRGRARLAAAAAATALLAVLWLRDARRVWPREQILDAIRFVESSDRAAPPDGDGGLAIGPYQIHEVYWRDALAAEPGLGGTYADCRRRDYAERVIAAYMRRHAPAAWDEGDAQVIARVHNGGPKGADKAATLGYWERVRARLP